MHYQTCIVCAIVYQRCIVCAALLAARRSLQFCRNPGSQVSSRVQYANAVGNGLAYGRRSPAGPAVSSGPQRAPAGPRHFGTEQVGISIGAGPWSLVRKTRQGIRTVSPLAQPGTSNNVATFSLNMLPLRHTPQCYLACWTPQFNMHPSVLWGKQMLNRHAMVTLRRKATRASKAEANSRPHAYRNLSIPTMLCGDHRS
jgi:hypothetical protein